MRKSRDMHWLRIDRYYSSDDTFEGDVETKENIAGLGDSLTTFGRMEQAAENPQVTFQPVMCQHCNHAPCETVCPVAASSHGRQGQNHMATIVVWEHVTVQTTVLTKFVVSTGSCTTK